MPQRIIPPIRAAWASLLVFIPIQVIAEAIISHDSVTIKDEIRKQDQSGAHYIDLNAGTGGGDTNKEIEDMYWLIDQALESTNKKLSIDSANPLIIQKAFEYTDGRCPLLINSIKYEPHILGELLPLAAENDALVIALAMGTDKGIPETVDERIEVCESICNEAEKAGLSNDKLFFDPLVMPISSLYYSTKITLDTLQKIKKEFPEAKTTVGVSNVSYGLKKRLYVNEAFLIAAISHGLDSAICDPTSEGIRRAIVLGRLIAGQDKYCRKYTRAVRQGEFGELKK